MTAKWRQVIQSHQPVALDRVVGSASSR